MLSVLRTSPLVGGGISGMDPHGERLMSRYILPRH
jgi:hypothetical protein